MNSIQRWFKESYWVGDTPVIIKTLLYVFLMIGFWNIAINSENGNEWTILHVIKQTFIIWFVGLLAQYMAATPK
jgi:hypothetical protein